MKPVEANGDELCWDWGGEGDDSPGEGRLGGSGFFLLRSGEEESRERILDGEWGGQDLEEALTWLVESCEAEMEEAPFPLILPRGHIALYEAAAERLMARAFGGWGAFGPIREIDAVVVWRRSA